MLKFLRSVALAVVMLLPFASNAQTLTVADGTATNAYVPIYGYYADAYLRSQFVYPAEDLAEMTGGVINQMTFYTSEVSVGLTAEFEVMLAEVDEATLNAWNADEKTTVYSGVVTIADNMMAIQFSEPFAYSGGNLLVEFVSVTTGNYSTTTFLGESVSLASLQGYSYSSVSGIGGTQRNFLPKVTFDYVAGTISCYKPYALNITDTAFDGFVLHWSDSNAEGTTYTIRTGEMVVASGLTETFYAFTGLNANTTYTYSVFANCAEDDESYGSSISIKTPCGPMTLPFTEDFEDIAFNGAHPDCWNTVLNYDNDPSANNNQNHTAGGSNSMYMAAYSDYNMFASNAVPVAGDNIYVSFWGRRAGYGTNRLQAGVMTDLEDTNTFIPIVTYDASNSPTNTWFKSEFTTIGLDPEATYYVAWKSFTTSTYSSYAVFVDDITIDAIPECFHVMNLAAESTSNTVTLNWVDDINEEPVYTILDMNHETIVEGDEGPETVVAPMALTDVTIEGTTAVVSGLEANKNYTLGVVVACAANDTVTVEVRTLNDADTITAFSVSGAMLRDELVVDPEAQTLTIPVWYESNLSGLTINWTLPAGAAFFVDTLDGTYTCQVTTTTVKNYLPLNTPVTLRLKAEDRDIYNDYVVTLVTEECVAARNITFSAERIRATVSWENPDTLVTDFNLIVSATELDEEALAEAEYQTVTGRSYTIEGLERGTQYFVYLKSACSEEWLSGSVTTLALGTTETCVIADGTGTSSYVPFYGLYMDDPHGTQSVYPAALLTDAMGKTITSLHYYVSSGNNPNWGTDKPVRISMAIVDVENLAGGYQDITNATVVYDGTVSGSDVSVAGGLTLVLDQPFTYEGGNLLIAVQANPDDVNGYGSVYFYGLNNQTSASRYGYNINNYNFTASGTAINFLPKFSFEYTLPADACPQVTAIAADSISHDFAAISWTAADADYMVGNEIIVSDEMIEDFDNVTPVELAADATSYEAEGLIPDHTYYVYIRALCNGEEHDEGMSGWATYTFTTFPTCRVADNLTAEITGKHTATISWVNGGENVGQADNFDVLVSTILYNAEELATANPSYTGVAATSLNLTDLMSDTTYYFWVRNVNEELECTAAWSEYGTFHTVAVMPNVVDLEAINVAHNAMTAVWLRNEANFADETAWRVAITLHEVEPAEADWRTVTTSEDYEGILLGYTMFTGLTPETAYDIYVAPYDALENVIGDAVMVTVSTTAFPPACYMTEADSYNTTNYLPLYGVWADANQVNQMIYPASMLASIENKAITSMHYFVSSGDNGNWEGATVTVKLAEVEASVMSGSLMTVENQTTVFTGNVTINAEDGMVITFDEPYVYNGGNLLVEFDLETNGSYRSVSFYSVTAENSGVYTYNTYVVSSSELPVVEFCYIRENTCLEIDNVYVMDITGNSANISWYPGNEESVWEYAVYPEGSDLEAIEPLTIESNELAATGLLRDTTYYFSVRAVCDAENELYSDWRTFVFHTEFAYYDVEVNVAVSAEEGTVTGAGQYTEGDEVTLEATAATGYHFVAWMNGDDTLSTENPYIFVVNENVDIQALFAINTYTVTVAVNDETMGYVDGLPETETVNYGTVLNLTAMPNEGYRFVSWSNNATTAAISVTVTGDVELTANFEVVPTYTVTVVATEGGTVTNAGQNTVAEGATFTATATANEGYHFVGWSNGETNATVTITVTGDITLTANFQADQQAVYYTITVNYDQTMGTVSGAGPYLEGSVVTLTATANPGYEFLGWSNGETTTTISFVATQNMTLSANFGLVGIDDVDMDNVNIYSVDSKIVVRGAEGSSIYVFDVNGRTLNRVNNATDMVEFRMEQTGVYLVKVGNAAAKRVVVVR